MPDNNLTSGEIRIFLHHIYEYQKGVRNMVLYTLSKQEEPFVRQRLGKLGIDYIIQPVNTQHINLFFGKKECMGVVRQMIDKPLNELSPEEDFILGVMLGYDICKQCVRYCKRRNIFKTA